MNLYLSRLGLVVTLILILAVMVFLPQSAVPQSAEAGRPVSTGSQTFIYPKINGMFVDRCLYWGKQCGWPAAHQFCRLKGYDKAVEFQWAYKRPTLILGTNEVCNIAKGCGAISRVRCVKAGAVSAPLGTESGKIVARIERKAYNCRKAGKLGARYFLCRVSFSLLNTTNKPIRWTSGKWETAYGPSAKMDRRQFGYRHAMLKPGRKEVYTLDCNIPKGYGHGIFSAWGSGRHPGDANKHRFGWRISIKCP